MLPHRTARFSLHLAGGALTKICILQKLINQPPFVFHTPPLSNRFATEWYKTQKDVETRHLLLYLIFVGVDGFEGPCLWHELARIPL